MLRHVGMPDKPIPTVLLRGDEVCEGLLGLSRVASRLDDVALAETLLSVRARYACVLA